MVDYLECQMAAATVQTRAAQTAAATGLLRAASWVVSRALPKAAVTVQTKAVLLVASKEHCLAVPMVHWMAANSAAQRVLLKVEYWADDSVVHSAAL